MLRTHSVKERVFQNRFMSFHKLRSFSQLKVGCFFKSRLTPLAHLSPFIGCSRASAPRGAVEPLLLSVHAMRTPPPTFFRRFAPGLFSRWVPAKIQLSAGRF